MNINPISYYHEFRAEYDKQRRAKKRRRLLAKAKQRSLQLVGGLAITIVLLTLLAGLAWAGFVVQFLIG